MLRISVEIYWEDYVDLLETSFFFTMIKKFLLSAIFLTLITLFFSRSFLFVIGVYALHLWCLDNFESIINIGIFLLQKQTSPCEYRSLKQRFGNWAGNYRHQWPNSFRYCLEIKLKILSLDVTT